MTQFQIPKPSEQVIPSFDNLFKIVLLFTLLSASFFTAQHSAQAFDVSMLPHWAAFAIKWGVIMLLALFDCIMLVGLGALAHDAVHKVLFRSVFWNDLWGGVLTALILAPFYANRQIHLTHHAYAHQPGLDPENEMHHRSFVGAMTIGSLMGFHIHYRIILYELLHFTDKKQAVRVSKDLFFLSVAGTVYFVLLPALGLSLLYTLVPMLLFFPLVFAWRALSDHYGIPPVVRESKKKREVLEPEDEGLARDQELWKVEVSGWVVLTWPWLEWLWSGVNYHEVHHKYPYLSHRYLKDVFEATRMHNPYLVVHGYWRSLINLRKRDYYTKPEEVRPFLVTGEE